MWRARSTDHRGRPVKLYRSGILPLPAPIEHPIPRDVWTRARRRVERAAFDPPPFRLRDMSWDTRARLLSIAVLPGALMILAMGIAIGAGAFPWGTLPIYFPLLGAFVALLVWRRRFGLFEHQPRNIIRGLLQELLCPACGYSLRTATLAEDGCRVCPECGGAWRIEGAAAEGGPG